MSHIDELIKNHCPTGVEFKSLGDVGVFIRGNGLQKSDLTNIGFPAIHYGQVHTIYGTSATETVSFVTTEFAAKLRKAEPGDLVIATTSEDDQAVAKAVAWVGETPAAVSGDAFIYRHSLEPKYVSYFFQSEHFQTQKTRGITGTKVRRISGESLAKIKIPVPPIEVQREIVRVLDTFSKLEAELEAELEARRNQYTFYRDQLLTFTNSDIRWATMTEICEISRGKVISKDYLRDNSGPYPVYSSQTQNNGIFGYIDTYAYDFESITWTTDGANAGSVFYHNDEEFSITNVCGLLRVKDAEEVSCKYVYYQLGKHAKAYVNEGMGNPKLMANAMGGVRIPIPEREEQEKIVSVLDQFDALVNDLNSGLPAELNARRQQYEYYRDRLLTFQEVT